MIFPKQSFPPKTHRIKPAVTNNVMAEYFQKVKISGHFGVY